MAALLLVWKPREGSEGGREGGGKEDGWALGAEEMGHRGADGGVTAGDGISRRGIAQPPHSDSESKGRAAANFLPRRTQIRIGPIKWGVEGGLGCPTVADFQEPA